MACYRDCYGCVKFLVLVVNMMVMVTGLSITCVSAWLLVEEHLYLQTPATSSGQFAMGSVALLVVGITVTLVAFIGCCGAHTQSRCLLGIFASFLLLLALGKIILVVLILFKQVDYSDLLTEGVRETVLEKYHPNNTATVTYWDNVQQGLSCCGESGPSDWSQSVYNSKKKLTPEIGIGSGTSQLSLHPFKVPMSCCRSQESPVCSSKVLAGDLAGGEVFFTEGCASKLINLLSDHIIYLFCAGIGLVLTELLGATFSICLCCTIKKIEDMKA